MSHGYVSPGYVKTGYAVDTGVPVVSTPPAGPLTKAVRIRSSDFRSQVFISVGPEEPQVEYEFSNGRTFKEPRS